VECWTALGDATNQISCLFTESIMTDGISSFVTTDRKQDVDYLDLFRHNFIGNQVFCPLQRLLDIGGFDEALPAWEDLEMFMRLLKRFGPARRAFDPSYVCHADRNRERISTSAARQLAAYEKILAKTADVPSDLHQELFLQLFSSFYGTVPTIADWRRMLAWRPKPQMMARLAKAALRNAVRQHV
jgi:hypothetical protein